MVPETVSAVTVAPEISVAPTPQQLGVPGTKTATQSAMTSFTEWAQTFRAMEDPAQRETLIPAGRALAAERRPVFKALIKSDPRAALQAAVPMVVRQSLPGEILELLEERVNDRGTLRVYSGVGPNNAGPVPTVRIAETQHGKTYQAFVYGRRLESILWTAGASLNGVAVDEAMAVNEDPFRTLEIGEKPDPEKVQVSVCPVSGKDTLTDEQKEAREPIVEETPAIEAFGEIVYLCNGSHAVIYREQLLYAEGGSGGATTFTGILPAAPTPSIGNIRVLVIPMTFADQNDTQSSESALYTMMRNVGEHYALASYGKMTLATTVCPPVKVEHDEAWYIQKDSSNGGPIDGLGQEHSHARAEARKIGFDDEEYDCVVVRLKGGARPAGGWGGGKSVWIYGDGVDVTAHEIGHVFGLLHANFWDTAGTSAIGSGANEEYGGHFDVMGGVGLPKGHYNAQAKNQIRWLPNEFVSEVTASGTYRIHAQDQPILNPSERFALKIRKDAARTYWGELRGLYEGVASMPWADQGLILGWKYPSGSGSNIQLIDTTPGTSFGKDDAPISLGRTFSDLEAGIHVTTIGVNRATSTTSKSVDVVVNLGSFPTNRLPVLTLAASATVVPTGVPVTFMATASDPDGDALAYAWQHFGDGSYYSAGPNAATTTRSFPTAGTYVVSCTVSDMKGGSVIRSQLITVGNGGGRFTLSGLVTRNGQGLGNVIVQANSANAVITDSAGRYTMPNLPAATYVVTAALYGYTFTELFNNNITLGPSFAGADFEAGATSRVSIAVITPTTDEGSSTPAVVRLSRTGDASLPLTVNFTAVTGTASTGDYALVPAMGSGSQGMITQTIPAGAADLDVLLNSTVDTTPEGPETVILQLVGGAGYLVESAGQVTLTILDDDTSLPSVGVVASVPKMEEGSAVLGEVTFSRSANPSAALTVNYTLSGSATSGSDFVPLSGTATFASGSATLAVPITSINDSISESLETIVISLTPNAAYLNMPTASSASVSVIDDDVQVVSVIASDASAKEKDLSVAGTAADTGTFLISRTGDTSQALTVFYAMAGPSTGVATALHGADYEELPGSIVIPAGQTSAAVTIIPRFDGIGESQESVFLQLGAGPTNYRLGTQNSASLTIDDAEGSVPYVEVLGVDNAIEGATPTNGRFRFSVKGSSTASVTVNYTVSGTATSGVDYTALSGSVIIPGNGINTSEITVVPINDALAEDLETVILTITPSASYQIFGPSSTATAWLYDDEVPTVFVDANVNAYPPTLTENGTGGTFYVSRTGSTTAALTVNYTLSGTAISGTDYTAPSGSVTIAAGAKGADIQITPINDAVAEGAETIIITLTDGGGYSTGPTATYYLTDDEAPTTTVAFASAGTKALENVGTISIPVTLSAAATSPVTVEYLVNTAARDTSVATGTPPSLLPYWVRCERVGNVISGMISPDGVSWTTVSTQTVSVPSASYMAGLCVNSYNTTTLSTATFDNVSISNLSAGGTQGARTGANLGTTSVVGSSSVAGSVYTVAGAGDNVEGTTDQGYYTYWPITNSANCTITARVLSQSNTNALGTAGVMIRESITNNVRRGFMAATPSSGFEYHYRTAVAAAEAKVTSAGSPTPFWARIQRVGDVLTASTSSDGTNWNTVGSPQTMPMGTEVWAGLAASSQDDTVFCHAVFDNTTLTPGPLPALQGRTIGFSGLQGSANQAGGVWTVEGAAAGVNGTNDDCFAAVAPISGDFTLVTRVVSATGGSAPQAGLLVRESLSRRARSFFVDASPGATPELSWRAQTSTSANGVGVDYNLTQGVLTFPAGSTEQSISLNIINDTMSEPDETISLQLRFANGVTLGTQKEFNVSIVDDDTPPVLPFVGFGAETSNPQESIGTALVPLTLSVPTASTVTVNYAVTAGTATADDFTAATGTVTFPPGSTTQFIAVAITDDAVIENGETVLLALTTPANALLSSAAAHTLTITDDDRPVVTMTSSDTAATESGDPASVTLTRTGPTTSALAVAVTLTGTATITTDYTGLSTTLTIPVGQASATFFLTPVQDTTGEGNETVIVTLANNANYTVGTTTTLTLNLADDDRNQVSIVANTASVTEGSAAGTLTLSRTGSTTAALTVNLTVSGTATNGTDYTTVAATATFTAGQSTRVLTITPMNDTAIEGLEVILISLATGSYDIGSASYASMALIDNDVPPTVFISSPSAQGTVVAPGNGLNFEATMEDDNLPNPVAGTWSMVSGPGVVNFNPATSTTGKTAATFSAPGNYVIRVTASDGQYSVSDQIAVTVGGVAALAPADWITTDIGPPTARGSSGPSGAGYAMTAAGTGLAASSSDRAHAMSRQITGDGTIVARLTGLIGSSATREMGIDIRDSLHRYSRRASIMLVPGTSTLRFGVRTTANTNETAVTATGKNFPLWVKLDRVAATNTITASYATDNAGAPGTWNVIGAASVVTMDATADYSVLAASGSDTATAAATVDNVSLTPAAVGPATLIEDLGSGTQTGTYAYNATTNVHTLAGQSGSLDNVAMFYGQSVTGDFVLTTLMTSATSGADSAMSGIMIRDSLDNGPMAFVGRNPFSAYSSFIWRTNSKGSTDGLNGISQTVRWLRFIRKGNQLTALHAPNVSGVPGTWVQMGQPQNVFIQPSVVLGLAVCNGAGVGLNTATFTNLTIVPVNKAPIVEAGTPPTTVASPLSLLGTVTDDSLPAPFVTQWSAITAASPVTFANAAALSTTVSFTTPGAYTLRLTANDTLASTFDDLSFTLATPFEQWRNAQFVGGTSNANSAPTADPDQDGLTNLVEYALGTNPAKGNGAGLQKVVTTDSGQRYFQVTIQKNPAATDVTIKVESSTSLAGSSWGSTGLVEQQNTSTLLQVRSTHPYDSTNREFFRVTATLAP